jgi:hypothetical protein
VSPAHPRAAAFHQAVATAEAAIRRRLALRQVFPDPSREPPQAKAARLRNLSRELAAAGETLTAEQVAALAKALAKALEGAAKPREPGRPRKRRSTESPEWAAAVAGLDSLGTSPLPLYANPFGPGLSRCAAVAEAMRRCGLRKGATPAAVAKVARAMRKDRLLRRLFFSPEALDALAAYYEALDNFRQEMPPDELADFSETTRRVANFMTALADLAEIFPPGQRRGRSCTGESS